MPAYDYECYECGRQEIDVIEPSDKRGLRRCPEPACRGLSRRIISQVNYRNEDGDEYRSSAEVVDPEQSPEAAEFKRNPTRVNRERWMKKHNLRFFEDGEKPQKPPPVNMDRIVDDILYRQTKKNKIEVSAASE